MMIVRLVNDLASEGVYLTSDEMACRLTNLSRADLARLQALSRYFARCPEAGKDLLQGAYERALRTTQFRRESDIVGYLAGAMRSIQNAADTKAKRDQPHRDALEREPEASCAAEPKQPLDALVARDDDEQFMLRKRQFFSDDQVALDVLDGIFEGFKGDDLCELVGVTKAELATKRRFIKRRLDAGGGLDHER